MRSPKTSSKRPSRPPPPIDGGDAFVPDFRRGAVHLADEEADALAEEYLASATSGEEAFEDARDEVTDEEVGGPFLQFETTPKKELES